MLSIILFLFSKGNILYLPSSAGQDAGMSVRVCLFVCSQEEQTKDIIQSAFLTDIHFVCHFGGMKR